MTVESIEFTSTTEFCMSMHKSWFTASKVEFVKTSGHTVKPFESGQTYIVLFDFGSSGHHPIYQELAVESALKLATNVVLISPCAGKICDKLFAGLPLHFTQRLTGIEYKRTDVVLPRWFRLAPGLLGMIECMRIKSLFCRCMKEAGIRTGSNVSVFFLMLDSILSAWRRPSGHLFLMFLRPYRWSGVLFGYYEDSESVVSTKEGQKVARFLKRAGLHEPKLYFLCPDSERAVARSRSLVNQPDLVARSFPDVTSTFCEYPAKLCGDWHTIAKGRFVVCLAGILSKHKGLIDFIALSNNQEFHSILFLAVGPLIKAEYSGVDLAKISEARGRDNFILIDSTFIDSQLNWFVRNSDAIFCGYRGWNQASNILVKAAYFKKPVICSDGKTMAAAVRKYGLGQVYDQSALESCALVLRSFIDRKFRDCCDQNGCETFFRLNSRERLDEVLLEVVAAPACGE